MTRVCLVGADGIELRDELWASETARDALASYELDEPYANCVAVDTISIGAAVSLCNDLNWYLRRYVADTLVLEPSVSGEEWLSRSLATAVRNERVAADETATFLKIYGVVEPEVAGENDDPDAPPANAKPALAEPLFARRVGGETPEYDLREVLDTVVVRVTADEFGA
ncbi:MAG: DUF5804 family protein [Halobacteriales archaeon]|nr:DUF5804 family protein [Halobacteriales archaeon]